MLKLLLNTFILKNYVVMKYSLKLVSHWAVRFGDRNWKYPHDNLLAIFHIDRLMSNGPQKQLLPSQSHEEEVITKLKNNFFSHENRQ